MGSLILASGNGRTTGPFSIGLSRFEAEFSRLLLGFSEEAVDDGFSWRYVLLIGTNRHVSVQIGLYKQGNRLVCFIIGTYS